MGETRLLTDGDVKAIADQISSMHPCRFTEAEAESLHLFAQSIRNGGWVKWTAILEFGETLIQIKKASIVAGVGILVTGALTAAWFVIVSAIRG